MPQFVDLYIKPDIDPTFSSTEIETNEPADIFIQQILMYITTDKSRVLGNPDFGENQEKYLFNTNISTDSYAKALREGIALYCPLSYNFNYDIRVRFMKQQNQDIAMIEIFVDGLPKSVVFVR